MTDRREIWNDYCKFPNIKEFNFWIKPPKKGRRKKERKREKGRDWRRKEDENKDERERERKGRDKSEKGRASNGSNNNNVINNIIGWLKWNQPRKFSNFRLYRYLDKQIYLNKFELEFLFLVTGNIKLDFKSENIFYKHSLIHFNTHTTI